MENSTAQETQLKSQPTTTVPNLLPKPDEDAATFIIMPITEVEPASLANMKTESLTNDCGLITEYKTEIDLENSSMTDVTEGSVDHSDRYTHSQAENTYSCVRCSYKSKFLLGINRHVESCSVENDEVQDYIHDETVCSICGYEATFASTVVWNTI